MDVSFQVYNTRFLDMVGFVETTLKMSIERFSPDSKNAIKIWNVFLPKPDVPPAIAANYRQVANDSYTNINFIRNPEPD